MSVIVVVPWRWKGDPHRKRNKEFVIGHLEDEGWDVVVASDGREGEAPFNRSAAYNNGRKMADSDVYIFHEADCIVPKQQLEWAVKAADLQPGLVVPFTTYNYYDELATRLILRGKDPKKFPPRRQMVDGSSIGALGVASAESLDLIGQWDENFEGWGWDDNAMFHAFKICAGGPRWIDGDLFHLWHPPAWRADLMEGGSKNVSDAEHEATLRNRDRYNQYEQTTDPEVIREFTRGLR